MQALINYDQISLSLILKTGVQPTDELIGKLNYFLLLADRRYRPEIGDRQKYVYWCGQKCLLGILKKQNEQQSKFIPFSEVKFNSKTRLLTSDFLEYLPDKQPSPDKILEIKELRHSLLSNKRLTDREKQCIIGRYIDNLKIKDLGNNASSYIRSGLQKLKETYLC